MGFLTPTRVKLVDKGSKIYVHPLRCINLLVLKVSFKLQWLGPLNFLLMIIFDYSGGPFPEIISSCSGACLLSVELVYCTKWMIKDKEPQNTLA